MRELVHVFTTRIRDLDGHAYVALCRGERRPDGSWIGWLEFVPIGGGSAVRRTERETSQSSFASLTYWARGLEPVYLEGALERAITGRTLPSPSAPARCRPGEG